VCSREKASKGIAHVIAVASTAPAVWWLVPLCGGLGSSSGVLKVGLVNV
jgi:hypothetical protein